MPSFQCSVFCALYEDGEELLHWKLGVLTLNHILLTCGPKNLRLKVFMEGTLDHISHKHSKCAGKRDVLAERRSLKVVLNAGQGSIVVLYSCKETLNLSWTTYLWRQSWSGRRKWHFGPSNKALCCRVAPCKVERGPIKASSESVLHLQWLSAYLCVAKHHHYPLESWPMPRPVAFSMGILDWPHLIKMTIACFTLDDG